MKFLRHVLSHIMFIILLAGIAGVYYFRNQVLPESYVQTINLYAGKIHPELVSIASTLKIKKIGIDDIFVGQVEEKIIVSDVPEAEPVINNIEVENKEVVVVAILEVEANKIKDDIKTAETAVVKEIVPEVVNVKKEKDNKATSSQEEKEVIVESVSNTNKIVVVAPVVVSKEKEVVSEKINVVVSNNMMGFDKQTASYKEMLFIARKEFSKSNFEVSVNKYKELIELENHEADFYGELGNVYYAMGDWSKAGEAYYEAAQRLIVKGELNQVFYLQRVLQSLDAERARKLAHQITSLSKKNVSIR